VKGLSGILIGAALVLFLAAAASADGASLVVSAGFYQSAGLAAFALACLVTLLP
jgi:hypothetical protein